MNLHEIEHEEPIIERLPEACDNPVDTALDEERIERDEKILFWVKDASRVLNAYVHNQLVIARTTPNDVALSMKIFWLALGWFDVAGAKSTQELARQFGASKQKVSKVLLEFNSKLKLPPLPSQRDEEGRANIRTARKEQVGKTK